MIRLPLALIAVFACPLLSFAAGPAPAHPPANPFGGAMNAKNLDFPATGEWWKLGDKLEPKHQWLKPIIFEVPRDKSIAFALYTQDHGVLKLSAQMVPLLPDEPREVALEIGDGKGGWKEVAKSPVLYPGWSANFRIEDWDASRTVPYRLRHGTQSTYAGTIRRDPVDKHEIVVASLSCNSSRDRGDRASIVANLLKQDPDLLFFAGDQSYDHTMHTAAWLQFGWQFGELMRDRPTITIPDDHDIGQANLWGAGGKKADSSTGDNGGYFYPPEYVRMVERCQTWHLPDPADPAPIGQGIGVYFTRLRVGGIDFAILEDRKFKSGPRGNIPRMGPRPDHINDPAYDRKAIDLPGLELLGDRQLKFLDSWSQDWTGAEIKSVLSQTAFCGAVHLHGSKDNRLLADLDCNGWPQTGRNKALVEIRKARALHLCGDQHLAVIVQHGIDSFRDGPYSFTNPAIVNTIYGRWWWPLDEKAGPNPVPGSPLPWTGDYLDGLGNKISMLAYANPNSPTKQDARIEKKGTGRAEGYGLVRFNKAARTIRMEAWPRHASVSDGDKAQLPGWPVTIKVEDNDGRKPVGFITVPATVTLENPVYQVIAESDGEVLYTQRFPTGTRELPVYAAGKHTLRYGAARPDRTAASGLEPGKPAAAK